MIALRSLLDSRDRQRLVQRFETVSPDAAPLWGRMSAPQMLVPLSDQMRHTLGDAEAAPRPGPLRLPLIRQLVMYWLPWPKGRVKGPPEAFVTPPTTWGWFCHRHFDHHLRQFGA